MSATVSPWRLRWTNFRGYEKGPLIVFPALTLLIGRNNVGKTSSYAPLLLLRQSLDAVNPATALLFRGDLVDFGSYRDVVTDHDESKEMVFDLDFGEIGSLPWMSPDSRPRLLKLSFGCSATQTAEVRRSIVESADQRQLVRRNLQEDGDFKVSSPMLPAAKAVGRPLKEVTQLRRALQSEKPDGFLFSGVGGIHLPAAWRRDKDRWSKVQDWYLASSELFDVYQVLNTHVTETLRRLSYIGPLRSPPKRSYLTSAEAPTNVGRDGQWASEVLFRSSLGGGESTVLDQTNEWLVRLGYGKLEFKALGDYFQVFVRREGSSIDINLADCGAGLSQLLPLIVQGCVMDAGDTLVAQQPEIHLNPAQQDLITDFLIMLSQSGRRVIVETHSEHVLGRLRRRIAEGDSIASDDVAVYFSESEADRSHLRRIDIGALGEVSPEQWPAGFFAEKLNNSLKMAMAQSRRREQIYPAAAVGEK